MSDPRWRRLLGFKIGQSGATVAALAFVVVALPLVAVAQLDPAPAFTASTSPFSDEGFHALNARNLALFGSWGQDDWQLQLVQLPYSLLLAGVFEIFGVGLLQLRVLSIVITALTAAALIWGLSRVLGLLAAVVAGVAFATAPLVLYYGRLGYAEPLAAGCLLLGTLLVVLDSPRPAFAGLLGGLLLAAAIGTRQNTAFGVAGCLAGAAVCGGAIEARSRVRLLAAVGGLAISALAWAVLIWWPNRDALARVVTDILPAISLPHTIGELGTAMRRFIRFDDGLIGLLAPLAATALVSLSLLAARWRHVPPERLRLAGAAGGWAVGLVGIMAAVPYHPNRYAMPVVPALAVATGLGVATAADWIRSHPFGRRRIATAALAVVAAVAIAAPGLTAFGQWVSTGTARLPAIQAAYAAAVPRGAVVVGAEAPTFLMASTAQTIIIEVGTVPVNEGDLYVSAGARWWVVPSTDVPEVAIAHPAAWAARKQVRCDTWGGLVSCLYRLP